MNTARYDPAVLSRVMDLLREDDDDDDEDDSHCSSRDVDSLSPRRRHDGRGHHEDDRDRSVSDDESSSAEGAIDVNIRTVFDPQIRKKGDFLSPNNGNGNGKIVGIMKRSSSRTVAMSNRTTREGRFRRENEKEEEEEDDNDRYYDCESDDGSSHDELTHTHSKNPSKNPSKNSSKNPSKNPSHRVPSSANPLEHLKHVSPRNSHHRRESDMMNSHYSDTDFSDDGDDDSDEEGGKSLATIPTAGTIAGGGNNSNNGNNNNKSSNNNSANHNQNNNNINNKRPDNATVIKDVERFQRSIMSDITESSGVVFRVEYDQLLSGMSKYNHNHTDNRTETGNDNSGKQTNPHGYARSNSGGGILRRVPMAASSSMRRRSSVGSAGDEQHHYSYSEPNRGGGGFGGVKMMMRKLSQGSGDGILHGNGWNARRRSSGGGVEGFQTISCDSDDDRDVERGRRGKKLHRQNRKYGPTDDSDGRRCSIRPQVLGRILDSRAYALSVLRETDKVAEGSFEGSTASVDDSYRNDKYGYHDDDDSDSDDDSHVENYAQHILNKAKARRRRRDIKAKITRGCHRCMDGLERCGRTIRIVAQDGLATAANHLRNAHERVSEMELPLPPRIHNCIEAVNDSADRAMARRWPDKDEREYVSRKIIGLLGLLAILTVTAAIIVVSGVVGDDAQNSSLLSTNLAVENGNGNDAITAHTVVTIDKNNNNDDKVNPSNLALDSTKIDGFSEITNVNTQQQLESESQLKAKPKPLTNEGNKDEEKPSNQHYDLFTEEELYLLSEGVNRLCSDTSLETSDGTLQCREVCINHLCCFHQDARIIDGGYKHQRHLQHRRHRQRNAGIGNQQRHRHRRMRLHDECPPNERSMCTVYEGCQQLASLYLVAEMQEDGTWEYEINLEEHLVLEDLNLGAVNNGGSFGNILDKDNLEGNGLNADALDATGEASNGGGDETTMVLNNKQDQEPLYEKIDEAKDQSGGDNVGNAVEEVDIDDSKEDSNGIEGNNAEKSDLTSTEIKHVITTYDPELANLLVGSQQTEQLLLDIAELIMETCDDDDDSSLEPCREVCEDHMCCFNETASCLEDKGSLCALYAPCEVLLTSTVVDGYDSDLAKQLVGSKHTEQLLFDIAELIINTCDFDDENNSDIGSFEECQDVCTDHMCCFDGNENCADGVRSMCALYSPCRALLTSEKSNSYDPELAKQLIGSKNTEQLFMEIADLIRNTCDISDINDINSSDDVEQCQEVCVDHMCCFVETEGCAEEKGAMCSLYAPCEVLLTSKTVVTYDPELAKQLVGSKHTDQLLMAIAELIIDTCDASDGNGSLEQCKEMCTDHMCCFDQIDSCADVKGAMCALYAPCEVLVVNANAYGNTGYSLQDLLKIAQKVSAVCDEETGKPSDCERLCAKHECCFNEAETCADDETEMCPLYAACGSLFSSKRGDT